MFHIFATYQLSQQPGKPVSFILSNLSLNASVSIQICSCFVGIQDERLQAGRLDFLGGRDLGGASRLLDLGYSHAQRCAQQTESHFGVVARQTTGSFLNQCPARPRGEDGSSRDTSGEQATVGDWGLGAWDTPRGPVMI